MTAPELKPCPWCREIPRLYPAQDGSGFESIECDNPDCLFRPSYGYGPFEEVVEAWNTRAPDPDLEAHIGAVLAEAAEDVHRKHVEWVTSKGRNPDDYTSPYSWVEAAILALRPNTLTALGRAKEKAFQRGHEEAGKYMVPISYDGKSVFFDGEGDVGIYRDHEIEEIKRQARVEGMREAAAVAKEIADQYVGYMGRIETAIRALIEKEKSDV